MSNNKYQFKGTPWPWVIYKATTHAGIKTEAPNQITDIICLDPSPEWHPDNIDKWKYDAHLISAAPDLLEACIEVLQFLPEESSLPLKTETEVGNATKKIRAAIHKALNIHAETA